MGIVSPHFPGPRISSRRAFSMVEIILAVVVVGLAMLPIFTTLSSANRGAVAVEDEAQAVGLATEALEWAQGIGFRGWCQALSDEGRGLKLPGTLRFDSAGPSISFLEDKVASFKSDEPSVEVDYPDSSIRFGRELVMTFVRDAVREIRTVRANVTVRWKLNVRGSPERRLSMELLLHGRQF